MKLENKRKPYTGIGIEVIPVEMKGAVLVGSYGKSVVDDSKIQSVGQVYIENGATGAPGDFEFNWD